MPASSGPNIAGKSSLVFKYDTGDIRNSYKGKSTTNLLTTIDKSGTNDSTYFKTNSGTEVKYVPNVGVRTVHYVNILNDYYGGSGNCCPAPMFFGDFTVSPSTQYTYQIIFKTTTGYANPNYMYHYEFNSGTYVTEYGLWDSSRQVELGDGWIHAWGTFTSNASANRFITYLFHYEYGVWNKIEVAGIMLTQGSNIIPPTQFLDVNTTRSATQGLLPLVGNTSLDLSNVSFDSNAQMTFDGTDDRIQTSYAPTFGDFTVCLIFKDNGSGAWGRIVDKLYTTGFFISSYFASFGANYIGAGVIEPNYPHGIALPYEAGRYHYFASVRNGTTHTIYLDGITQTSSKTVTSNLLDSTSIAFGDWSGSNTQPFKGELPVVRIYNRALSAAEVRQNYLHYKTRFNLS
jgi:hypothetical protein